MIKPGDIVLDENDRYYLILKKGRYGNPSTLGFQMLPIVNTTYSIPTFWPNKPIVMELKKIPLIWDSVENLNNKKYYKKIIGER